MDSVTIGGTSYPVLVINVSAMKVELEIAGERVLIDNWPEHFAAPPGPVDVNGERWSVGVEPTRSDTASRIDPRVAASTPSSPRPVSSTGPAPAGGVAVIPPMPGKIIEVRVSEGDRVTKGHVLLVLEAMKMRNEIASPAAGVIRRLRVVAGANVRARDPMLFVVPDPGNGVVREDP